MAAVRAEKRVLQVCNLENPGCCTSIVGSHSIHLSSGAITELWLGKTPSAKLKLAPERSEEIRSA